MKLGCSSDVDFAIALPYLFRNQPIGILLGGSFRGSAGKLRFMQDHNRFDLDPLGNIVSTTLMAFPDWNCVLDEMHLSDPTGQRRRVSAANEKGKHS